MSAGFILTARPLEEKLAVEGSDLGVEEKAKGRVEPKTIFESLPGVVFGFHNRSLDKTVDILSSWSYVNRRH